MSPGSAKVVHDERLSLRAFGYMVLLAVQFGMQPILTKTFTPPSVCRSSVILVQEGVKFVIALAILRSNGEMKKAISEWSISSWIGGAGIPAMLYSIQNLAALLAYQNLDPLTFNVLNQTKTLSAALCCYFVMGKKQSKIQICSLFVLLLSALVIEKIVKMEVNLFSFSKSPIIVEPDPNMSMRRHLIHKVKDSIVNMKNSRHFTHGVAPVFLASFLSGLAGALSQKTLQNGRNSYLFSIELCMASTIFIGLTLLTSEDGVMIAEYGFFNNWKPQTLIPIVSNACGGIIVGLVTKYAGSVRKGFALIFGILLSGLFQALSSLVSDDNKAFNLTKEQLIGGMLAASSLWAHATYPYSKKTIKIE